ncbi:unnamed protein product [Ectocarpus sp. CCAP 1310/34]|nr:unnamed protein product [Ectocarpus sp. CCAP 1310/34]
MYLESTCKLGFGRTGTGQPSNGVLGLGPADQLKEVSASG